MRRSRHRAIRGGKLAAIVVASFIATALALTALELALRAFR